MRSKNVMIFALTAAVVMGTTILPGMPANVLTDTAYAAEQESAVSKGGSIRLTDEEIESLDKKVELTRTSVHDPSVTYDSESGNYYIFGSHMGVSKSVDLENWKNVFSETEDSGLYGVLTNGERITKVGKTDSSNIVHSSYADAFKQNAFKGKVTATYTVNGKKKHVKVRMGDYNIADWISSDTVKGNQWAPDIVYNKKMDKWCMYLSLNGPKWNSAIVLLTADKIEGPYIYEAPVVYSGFSAKDSAKSYTKTDLEIAIGEQESLPSRYDYISNGKWGEVWPHAIDPCVYYDQDDNLMLTYGSWSGGIYTLKLDAKTGLRDYKDTYVSDFNMNNPGAVTEDPYFGKKIAGGYYVSGEGSYVKHIGDYYYLFLSYGFYDPTGGYNMRVFRSTSPEGPFLDTKGNNAIFDKYIMNYSAVDTMNNRGEKLMGGYKWDTMTKAELSQGHNSVITDSEGRSFVVYHTKFNDGTAAHEIRVHQLYMNEDGWLVAAPYEFTGETLKKDGFNADEVAGDYQLITHKFQINYSKLAYESPENIRLDADGTISGTHDGSWSLVSGTPYINITIDGSSYKGVVSEEHVNGTNIPVKCFSAVDENGQTVWGSGEASDRVAVAEESKVSSDIPMTTYTDLKLKNEGLGGTDISWTSSDPSVLSSDGKIGKISEDTEVTLTEHISKGDYYYDKNCIVRVRKNIQNDKDEMTVGKYLMGSPIDLAKTMDGSQSVADPFYKGTNNGLDLSGGVSIEFDTKTTGDIHFLGTLLSFMGSNGDRGRLYFTPGSYLGYNAAGSYFDANMKNYGLVKDYIGAGAHVKITITKQNFEVNVNGNKAFDSSMIGNTDGFAGTTRDYSKVLDWLQNDADRLYFGYGSWWHGTGYDEANAELSNVVCKVLPINKTAPAKKTYDAVSYKKDKVEISSNDTLFEETNPFYKKNIKNLHIEYTINMKNGTPKNGWDGIFSFYETASGKTGRISFESAPYICYNDQNGNWMDINQPADGNGHTDMASSFEYGTDHRVVIDVTADGASFKVDGKEIKTSFNGSGTDYNLLLSFIGDCDRLSYGVGLAKTAFWNTEQCTLSNIIMSSEAE